MHFVFTLCARICFYYRITSNICMRRRLNVCHSFCSNAPKQLLPFSTRHSPVSTLSFGTQNPLAFAFMCGANTNLPSSLALCFSPFQTLCGHANRGANISHFTESKQTKGPGRATCATFSCPALPAIGKGVQLPRPGGQVVKNVQGYAFHITISTQFSLF